MRSARICERFILAAGVLILAGGLAHTFLGWPALRAEMTAQSVTPDLMRAAGIGWIFGGTAMDVLGVLTIMSWSMLRSGARAGRPVAAVIGAFYALFGAGASTIVFPETHFLSFVAVGAMLFVAAIAWKGIT